MCVCEREREDSVWWSLKSNSFILIELGFVSTVYLGLPVFLSFPAPVSLLPLVLLSPFLNLLNVFFTGSLVSLFLHQFSLVAHSCPTLQPHGLQLPLRKPSIFPSIRVFSSESVFLIFFLFICFWKIHTLFSYSSLETLPYILKEVDPLSYSTRIVEHFNPYQLLFRFEMVPDLKIFKIPLFLTHLPGSQMPLSKCPDTCACHPRVTFCSGKPAPGKGVHQQNLETQSCWRSASWRFSSLKKQKLPVLLRAYTLSSFPWEISLTKWTLLLKYILQKLKQTSFQRKRKIEHDPTYSSSSNCMK